MYSRQPRTLRLSVVAIASSLRQVTSGHLSFPQTTTFPLVLVLTLRCTAPCGRRWARGSILFEPQGFFLLIRDRLQLPGGTLLWDTRAVPPPAFWNLRLWAHRTFPLLAGPGLVLRGSPWPTPLVLSKKIDTGLDCLLLHSILMRLKRQPGRAPEYLRLKT